VVDPTPPELFDTTYDLPTGGTTHTVNAGGNLQNAINAAALGDVIVLEAGATFTGTYYLPPKEGTGWIYIISSELDQLPEGVRVTLADSVHMPKLFPSNINYPAIRTEFNGHHYRLAGIEVVTNASFLNLVQTGYGVPAGQPVFNIRMANTLAEVPHHITFDRMLIHSTNDGVRLRNGLCFNGLYMACIDSYIANCKDGADAQAIWTFLGNGPYKIVNNFLEGTGENYLCGAADTALPLNIPADVEFRNNHCYKRPVWRTVTNAWGIKNIFEIKNGERFAITGNVFENNWADAQAGTAILFTVRNQNGTATYSRIRDILYENNLLKETSSGISITAEDDLQQSDVTKRVKINNNLIQNLSSVYGISPRPWATAAAQRPITDVQITHNTVTTPGGVALYNDLHLNSATINIDGLDYSNNIWIHGNYNIALSRLVNYTMTKNVIAMYPPNGRYAWNKANFNSQYPGGNFMADPYVDAVGFVDYAGGNFRLAPSSPYKNLATDGTDPGCNIDVLEAAIDGVVDGSPPTVNIGSATGSATAMAASAIEVGKAGTATAGATVQGASAIARSTAGSVNGIATVQAVGDSTAIRTGAGSSNCVSTTSAVGSATSNPVVPAVGNATGLTQLTGVGRKIAAAIGTSAAYSESLGLSQVTLLSAGSSNGVAQALAVSNVIRESQGSIVTASTVNGVSLVPVPIPIRRGGVAPRVERVGRVYHE
jgi:hypothetical protein